jgi:hypothetical protein
LLSAKQIPPGQSGQIEVSIKTETAGPISKTVAVTTNDPRQSQIVLGMTGVVLPEVDLSERLVFFGNVPKGKEASKEILVTIPPDKNVKILSAESTDENFTAHLEPVPNSNGKKYRLVVKLKPTAAEGYHPGMIVVKTSSRRSPEIKITVRAIVIAAQGNY